MPKRKKVYNPLTGKYYIVEFPEKPKSDNDYKIIGLWEEPKKKKKKKSIWDIIFG